MSRIARIFDRLVAFQKSPVRAYGLCLSLFAVALALRFAVDQQLPTGFPFLTFFPAIIIAAFLGGFGPGLLTAVLSSLSAWYFFLPPFQSYALTPSAVVAMIFFIAIITVDLAIIEALMRLLRDRERERRRAADLAEQRDTLFREIQHRISNNLQAVAGLLALQSRATVDPDAKRALNEAIQRVSVIADIQRLFLDSGRGEAHLDDAFVREVVGKSLAAAGLEGKVEVELDVAPAQLPQEVFMPVALVLTECIANAIEHGLATRGGGRLRVSFLRDEKASELRLIIMDDGDGPPDGFDIEQSKSVGMRVILAFARQIGGRFELREAGGTLCSLSFPAPRTA